MPDIALVGCTPDPLMCYLKALGVFRLVAEQGDADARLAWTGGVAHLLSLFDRKALLAFLLDQYRPTPIVAPWNGGSGFYGGGSEHLIAIAHSTVDRLLLYRDTIVRIGSFVPRNKPKDEEKESLLVRCRSELADELVPWLDACFVLGEEGPTFFPLLGTGGNDGRLEFTNNFMQRLADVIPFSKSVVSTANSSQWLAASLFTDVIVALSKSAIGQFNPGGIGGPNGTQGKFEAGSRVNPWDFVLMIEGVLLFAGSVARRLGANAVGRAVFPFSVESVAVGYGSSIAAEETTDSSRAELWLPLWSDPLTFAEAKHLFSEGRAQFGRRQARNAVEFALAVNLMGVNRGVTAFARYGFLKRNGLAFLAAPLGRVEVTLRPQARLLDDPRLTEWIDRLRIACRDKDKTPARYQATLRQVDRAMYRFAVRSESGEAANRRALLEVLRALGRAERTLARGLAFCKDKYLRPLQGLSPQWLDQADDGSAEFGLAMSLAGIRPQGKVGPLREYLEEVELRGSFFNWSPGSTSAVWSTQSHAANIGAVFGRRQMEAFRDGQSGTPISSPRPARLADVIAFLISESDDEKLVDLLWALIAIDWPQVQDKRFSQSSDTGVPFAFGVPRLLVSPAEIQAGQFGWRYNRAREIHEADAKPDAEVFQVLTSGHPRAVEKCVDRASLRLKSGGRLVLGYRNRHRAGKPLAVISQIPASRLLAAMLFPLSNPDLEAVANNVLYPPETKE